MASIHNNSESASYVISALDLIRSGDTCTTQFSFDQKFGTHCVEVTFAKLRYELKEIEIRVQTATGVVIVVNAIPTSTIGDIKARIASQQNIPTQYQSLVWNDQTLRDDVSLFQIILDPHVRTADPFIILTLSPITIKVKTARSPSFIELTVALDDTVHTVKKMIDETQQFDAPARRLVLCDVGQELQNENRLFDYNIKSGDTLHVNHDTDTVFMFFGSKKKKKLCCFDLKSYDQIKDLKAEWMTRLGYKHFGPQQPMSIKIGRKKLSDEAHVVARDLAVFNINMKVSMTIYVSGLSLLLSKKSTVTTPINRTRYPIHCTEHWKVSKIKKQLYRNKKLNMELQRLTFNGVEMLDDDPLEKYGIEHESIIRLELGETTPSISVVAHDQGRRSVCYAYAIGTVLRAAEKRIVGRNPAEHHVIVNQLIQRYGDNGAVSSKVLEKECPTRQLRWKMITKQTATERLNRKHVLLGTFRLDDGQWARFCAYFREESTRSQVIRKSNIGPADGTPTEGHAVSIVQDCMDHWRIKNSWGIQWATSGFAKIGKNSLNMSIFHVYYIQQDLTEDDYKNYKKYGIKGA
eukprot:81376_1